MQQINDNSSNTMALYLESNLLTIVKNISSNNRDEIYDAIQTILKLMNDENNDIVTQSINRIFQYGIIPIIHEHLKNTTDKEIQYELSLIINRIIIKGTNEQSNNLFEIEIHKTIIYLLSMYNDNLKLVSSLLITLSNIRMGSFYIMDKLMNEGIIQIIIYTLSNYNNNIPLLVITTQFIVTFVGYHLRIPPFENIIPLFPSIKDLILKYKNNTNGNEIIVNILRFLKFLNYRDHSKEIIIDNQFSLIILDIMKSNSIDNNNVFISSGIETISTMLSSGSFINCSNVIINSDLIDIILKLLDQFDNLETNTILNLLTIISSIQKEDLQLIIDSGIIFKIFKIGNNNIDTLNALERIKRIDLLYLISDTIKLSKEINQILYLLDNYLIQFLKNNLQVAETDHYLLDEFNISTISILNRLEKYITNEITTTIKQSDELSIKRENILFNLDKISYYQNK